MEQPLQIIDYSDLSFAVVGNTQPYKDVLKALGGSYNPRLGARGTWPGGPGWIFSNRYRSAVETYLTTGVITPSPFVTRKTQAVSPSVSRGTTATQSTLIPTPSMARKSTVPPSTVPSPTSRRTPTTVSNTFIGSDGNTYQTITYTVIVPRVGQTIYATIIDTGEVYQGTVTGVSPQYPYDSITVRFADQDFEGYLRSGKWTIANIANHTVTFA